jgi:hypothetical protein
MDEQWSSLLTVFCAVLCCAGPAVDARSMEQAIDALQSVTVTSQSPAVDKHPEK